MFRAILMVGLALVAQSSRADSLEEAARILARHPEATLSADTQSIHDPVHFTVSFRDKKIEFSSTIQPLFEKVRRQVPARVIKSGEYTYEAGWQLLKGKDSVIFDLAQDIPEFMFDPSDFAEGEPPQAGYVDYRYKVLSIIGPLVSYQVIGSSYAPGAAHPNSTDAILTQDASLVNSSEAESSANLLSWVDASSLVEAMKKDRYLLGLLNSSARADLRRAQSVEAIVSLLEPALSDKCLSFPYYGNTLTGFAISDYNIQKNLVALRIQISPSAHVCEAQGSKELGVWVTPQPALEKYLRLAKKNNEGLFRNQVK